MARTWGKPFTLLASTTVTTSGASTAVSLPEEMLNHGMDALIVVVDLTAAASTGMDALALQLQTQLDGTNWMPVAQVNTIVGDGGTKRYRMELITTMNQVMKEAAASFSAGQVRHIFGKNWRLSWTVTDASGAASFTFSATAAAWQGD